MYIETLFFLNFVFDFFLLIALSLAINQKINIKKITFSSFIGSNLVIFLFVNINKMVLLIITIFISFIMIYLSFGKTNYIYNLLLFYFLSIFLGGYIYIIKDKFYLLILPLFFICYLFKRSKTNKYYKIKLIIDNKEYNYNSYLDTGNNLSYKGDPVIFSKHKFDGKKEIIPYKTIDSVNIIPCLKGIIIINHKKINCYIGYSKNLPYDILLNSKMEEICLTK